MLMIAGYELLSRGHPILAPGVSHDGDKVCVFEGRIRMACKTAAMSFCEILNGSRSVFLELKAGLSAHL